jgi:hypothetical protein
MKKAAFHERSGFRREIRLAEKPIHERLHEDGQQQA